jgi:NitT/TauT family transport system permease protein
VTAATRAWRSPAAARSALIVALFGCLELACRGGLIDPLVIPPPTEWVGALIEQVPTSEFRGDLLRTALEVALSFAIGGGAGVLLGAACWRVRLLGDVLEPYLVTLYAMPTLVFYPVLIALFDIGWGPIVAIAALMVLIPVTLGTMVALRSVPAVLPKLGRSLNCSRWQLYRKVLIPAATPLVFPSVRLGFIYAVIGAIAMEFILASRGLGYRIGLHYREFDIAHMWGLILVVTVLTIAATSVMTFMERRIRRDML